MTIPASIGPYFKSAASRPVSIIYRASWAACLNEMSAMQSRFNCLVILTRLLSLFIRCSIVECRFLSCFGEDSDPRNRGLKRRINPNGRKFRNGLPVHVSLIFESWRRRISLISQQGTGPNCNSNDRPQKITMVKQRCRATPPELLSSSSRAEDFCCVRIP